LKHHETKGAAWRTARRSAAGLDYLDEGTLGGHAQPNGFVTEYPGDPEFVETKMTTLLSVLAIWPPTYFPELNIY
jgi:hypothetical protein